jgi:hypothetical protein
MFIKKGPNIVVYCQKKGPTIGEQFLLLQYRSNKPESLFTNVAELYHCHFTLW